MGFEEESPSCVWFVFGLFLVWFVCYNDMTLAMTL